MSANPKLLVISAVSIGISHNILLARLATRRAKPGGVFRLREEEVPAFLEPLDIDDIWGFGWSAKRKIEERWGKGSTVLGALLNRTKGALSDVLGKKTGETLWKAVRGIDDTRLQTDTPRKSVSAEINVD